MRNDTHQRFPWGRIVDEIEVGPYHFIKYQPFKYGDTGSPVVGKSGRQIEDVFNYHIYVDGKDTGNGALNLDLALLLAIAWKNLGSHPEGVPMVMRALKVEDKPEPASNPDAKV